MMNFNVKDAKNFRDTVNKYYVSTVLIADERLHTQERVNNLQGVLDTDNMYLAKMLLGEQCNCTKSQAELKAEIEDFGVRIAAEKSALKTYTDTQAKCMADAENLVTSDLLNAIIDSKNDLHDDTKAKALEDAMIKFFKDNGLSDADAKGVKPFIDALGVRKTSDKGLCKTGDLTKADSKKNYTTILLRTIADYLLAKGLINPQKFTYVIKKKAKKN